MPKNELEGRPFPIQQTKDRHPPITIGKLIEILKGEDPNDFVMLDGYPDSVESYKTLRYVNPGHYFIKHGKSIQKQFFLKDDFPPCIAHKMARCVTLRAGHLDARDVDDLVADRLFGSKNFGCENEGVADIYTGTGDFASFCQLG